MELAKGLAMRVINEVPGEASAQREARIKRAVMLALSRPPDIKELEILNNYAERAVKDYQQDPESAKLLLKESFQSNKTSLPEAAALVSIARTIFNTDNFITRE